MTLERKIELAYLIGIVLLSIFAALGFKPAAVTTSNVGPAPTINVTVIGRGAAPKVQATVYTSDSTMAYVQSVMGEMTKDGWIVADSKDSVAATAHIVIDRSQPAGIHAYPTTVIRSQFSRELRWIEGRLTADFLADAINAEAKKL